MAPFDISNWNAAVIVTSDTCSKDPSQDSSGQLVCEKLESLKFNTVKKIIVPDEKSEITEKVKSILEDPNNVLIITVGGTGFCPRDVTPEATSILYDKQCNSVATALLMTSLRYSPYAALSRLTAGISGQCLIVNFPGKTKACRECFACLEGFLIHALEQIRFDLNGIKVTHAKQDKLEFNVQHSSHIPPHVEKSQEKTKCSSMIPIESSQQTKLSIATSTVAQPPMSLVDSTTNGQIISDSSCSGSSSCSSGSSSSSSVITQDILKPNDSPTKSFSSRTKSPWPLVDFSEALKILGSASLEHNLCDCITIYLDSLESSGGLLGQVLADNIHSKSRTPPFPVSTMDGYVLNVSKQMKNILPSIGTIQAILLDDKEKFDQMQNDVLQSSKFFCYQVNTGYRVPDNENFAIIPFEKTGPRSSTGMLPIYEAKIGRYIREAGSDLSNEDFLEAGTEIGPIELSLILSMGHKQVEIIKKPVIGILSTGDELVDPYSQTLNDQNYVYDCNLSLLSSLLTSNGFRTVSNGTVKDHPQELSVKITSCLDKCDILVITGGASMGTKDYVKQVIEEMGGTLHFGRINMKPGKPVAFASMLKKDHEKFIFSLPGNPVSAYITTVVLVIPFIKHQLRTYLANDSPLTIKDIGRFKMVEVSEIVDFEEGKGYAFEDRLEFVRAIFVDEEEKLVKVSIKQQSSRLLSLKGFDCLLIIEPSQKGLQLTIGQTFKAIKLFIK